MVLLPSATRRAELWGWISSAPVILRAVMCGGNNEAWRARWAERAASFRLRSLLAGLAGRLDICVRVESVSVLRTTIKGVV
jgi:hypothetical protein